MNKLVRWIVSKILVTNFIMQQVYTTLNKIYVPVVYMKQLHAEYSNNIRCQLKKFIPPGPLRGVRDLCIFVLYHGH